MSRISVAALLVVLALPSIARAQNEIPNAGFTIQFVDSQEIGFEAKLAIDNDPTTMWASAWIASNPPFPHEIAINLGNQYLLWGIGYLARQDGLPNGNVQRFEIYSSNDGSTWTLLSTGAFTNTMALQTNTFPVPTYGRFLKLRALDSVPSDDPTTAVAAEIKVYKFNGISDKVGPGEPFLYEASHDGVCTTGYRLYANDTVLSTLPVSALTNGVITLPGALKALGFYQIKISAFAQNVCNITADEKFSETVILSVEQGLSAPSRPTIRTGTTPPPPIPPATIPNDKPAPTVAPTPQPRTFRIPPKE